MKTTNKNDNNISNTFLRVVTKLSDIDQKAKWNLKNESFVKAEMRVIKTIKEHEGIHVTGLADILGVTKGAVSQILMKLQRKGVILKEKDSSNQSRLILNLTSKGKTVYEIHEKFHRELDSLIYETLEKSSEENKIFLQNFLDNLEAKILNIFIK